MARIDELLDRHSRDLDKLLDNEAAAFLRAYRSAAKEIARDLAQDPTAFGAQVLRVRMVQIESGIRQLEQRLGVVLDAGVLKAGERSIRNVMATIRRAEPSLREAGTLIENGALRRFTAHRGLALHRHSLRRYGLTLVETLQRDMVASTIKGETVDQQEARFARSLRGSGLEGRAGLISRMENSRAYNDVSLETIREADEQLPGGMKKRIHEGRDKRNHPFSRASQGVVAEAGAEFRVSAAKVRAAGAAMKKSTGGILWRRSGDLYVGMNLPAHFGERGRVVPFRAGWVV